MTGLRDRLSETLKDSMKKRDELKVSTLRMVMSALKNKDIEAEMKGGAAINDNEILSMLQGMIKQRRESFAIFKENGRMDLADKEDSEIKFIESFMPKQLSEDEVKEIAKKIIQETGAAGPKDMGKVMAVLKEKYAGQIDMGKAGGLIKQLLG
jgi:uncharacterized protein YqeY